LLSVENVVRTIQEVTSMTKLIKTISGK